MAITRTQLEQTLIKRCGGKLSAASLDGTTANGTNADLNDPIGSSMRNMGYTVQVITHVCDSDLAGVPSDDLNELLDRAEIRVLESIIGNLDLVDTSVGPRNESLSQLSDQIEKALERLRKNFINHHGQLETGVLGLGFQEYEVE